jgi:hypothetical protein
VAQAQGLFILDRVTREEFFSMTAQSSHQGAARALFGQEGELVSLRVAVEPRLLEDLLEALARLDFPVNPQLYHRPAQVTVEFPAYAARVDEVRDTLERQGFSPASLEVSRGLELTGA